MNKAAQALGRLGRGIPKNFTPEERDRRRALMAAINARRNTGPLGAVGVACPKDSSKGETSGSERGNVQTSGQ